MLTNREKECVQLASDGLSAKEIGERLSISQKTVEAHLRAARVRLNARNTVNLVYLANRAGLISVFLALCTLSSALSVDDFIRPKRPSKRIVRVVKLPTSKER